MANTKRQPKYDLKAADRKRNLAVQIGLTAIVVIFAVALVLYIVNRRDKKPAAGEAKAIRVTSSNLIKKEGTDEPKAVLSLYEDFLCPHCGDFEKTFGPTVNKLVDSGAVAADYYMVAILDSRRDRTTRRARATPPTAWPTSRHDAFRRFHAALYAQQPEEGVGPFPDNARLIEVARQAGAAGKVPTASTRDKYTEMATGPGQGDERQLHADGPDQRPGLQPERRPTR